MAGHPQRRAKKAEQRRLGEPTKKAERSAMNKERHAQARALVLAEQQRGIVPEPDVLRPYRPEDAELVLDALCRGETLRNTCRRLCVSESSIRTYLLSTPELEKRYAGARAAFAHAMAEDNLEDIDRADTIDTAADGAHVELGVLRFKTDVRRWTMGRYNSPVYGDKVTQVHEGGTRPIEHVVRGEGADRAMEKYQDALRKDPPA